ncbi:exopolyphosphatase [Hahella sp. KA22]|uniref:exopolyphosphatase n=1 Tax=Hahella sp. KA22 TaxID=1628392 RepID=UPI0019D43B48|nr:exopolyphosphatase [Hahella sp. KA22]
MTISSTTPADAVSPAPSSPELIAAIDMGSNSFHMVVAQLVHNEIRPLEKLGEKVQLAAGLDARNFLDEASQHRALACLERFAQRISGMPRGAVQIVGTNALRVAKNARAFIRRAEKLIGHPISVISGREEARLIYLGVAHSLSDDADNRLVIDIGGGSTEFIIGQRFETKELESLHMGCVSYRDRFFGDGKITQLQFARAFVEASRELLNIRNRYRSVGWHHCVGSSGSIKAIEQVLTHNQWGMHKITPDGLVKLKDEVVRLGKISQLTKLGVRKDRLSIFPAGLAILMAAFDVLQIEEMEFCDGALREGLLYDMIGRIHHEDVRERTINSLQERYHIDREHAAAVEGTAVALWKQLAEQWKLPNEELTELLRWASRLHEVGLAISHTQFHKHGAYLIRYSDLAGFSRQTQQSLAMLIRVHRRKILDTVFDEYALEDADPLKQLAVALRLAVVLQHSRNCEVLDSVKVKANKRSLTLIFPKDWLQSRPLTSADLEAEKGLLTKFGIDMEFREEDS